jgi:hypothetical protein
MIQTKTKVQNALVDHTYRGSWSNGGIVCTCLTECASTMAFARHQAEAVLAAIEADLPAGQQTTPAAAAGSTATVAATGERAPRFVARFDSVCPACPTTLHEGEDASWLDGEAVHVACAQTAGVEVFDRATW